MAATEEGKASTTPVQSVPLVDAGKGRASAHGLEELKTTLKEVAPGVFRLRAGEPEPVVPSMVREKENREALAAMPAAGPPLQGIRVWRMARGCRVEMPLASDEVIYGLGLQCKHLEQNGWRRTLFTASGDDNGKGMSHAPVPFYVSTAGYGVLVDSARYLTFSVGEKQRLAAASTRAGSSSTARIITDVNELYGPEHRNATSVNVDVPAARGVDLYLFSGPTMGDAIARYNLYSGGGCLPALSGLGPEYIFGAMLGATTIEAMCDRLREERMPVTSVGLEPGWETHAYSSSYAWNTSKFPEGFARVVRRKGYDLNLWCQLYIDPTSPLMPLLRGRVGDFEVWNGVVPDLADPQVRETYSSFLADNFIQNGVCGFKLDEVDGSPNSSPAYQEWMFPEFTSFPSGADGDQARNLLGRLGLQAMDSAFRRQSRRTFGLARANQAWSSPLSAALYSDEYQFSDYVRYNLSAGVQGLLWSPEVRQAEDERDWALRLAVSALSARMVINGWQFPHFPWQQPHLSANEQGQLLPDENPYTELARRFANLRMMLLPYLYQAYGIYHRKGIPPVRPLAFDWPDDASVRHLDDEWMLGPDLLVAPVTDENAFADLYRVELSDPAQVKPDAGVRMGFQDGTLSLDIAGMADGLPGGSMELDLKAGRCVVRLAARGTIGLMDLRLRRMEKGREVDVPELYKDDIRLDPEKWQQQTYSFTVSSEGRYRLLVGKGYYQRLPAPRRLQVRGLSFSQPVGDPRQSWKRLVYLPDGDWRDFWTGALWEGGRQQVVTATLENPPVFVRDGTLLPMAEPVVTLDPSTVLSVHLAAYGDPLRPCELFEDDGTTFDYEKGQWAEITVRPDGAVERPDHGQPHRYRVVGKAEEPSQIVNRLCGG